MVQLSIRIFTDAYGYIEISTQNRSFPAEGIFCIFSICCAIPFREACVSTHKYRFFQIHAWATGQCISNLSSFYKKNVTERVKWVHKAYAFKKKKLFFFFKILIFSQNFNFYPFLSFYLFFW